MKESKSNSIIIGLLVTIIIILGVLVVLLATGTVSFNKEVSNKNKLQNNGVKEPEIDEKEKTLIEAEAISIAKDKVKVAFSYIHSLSPYCGNNMEWGSGSDYIAGEQGDWYHEYDVSKQFKSKDELNKYLQTILSDELISKYNSVNNLREDLKDKAYTEKEGKLYCRNVNKGCGQEYNEGSTNFTVNNITTDKISLTASIGYDSCGESTQSLSATIELTKGSQDNWIITHYEEA